jgi:hypothetical protein
MSEGVDAMWEGVVMLVAVHCVLRAGFCSVHTFSMDRCLAVSATHCAVLCRAVLCCAGRAVLCCAVLCAMATFPRTLTHPAVLACPPGRGGCPRGWEVW